ncbi:hypothetical protein ACN38_g4015 [Penicillium nordicum]|uniref:Uncharacterized protein n=1 Tax=Penicillium nordicum TaxID=229535 RepID=A0A0M8P4K3_9EURO|nr:hypothetical protein ACN38_g4015 [Penicillium nordicum]
MTRFTMTLRGHYTARHFPERARIHLIIESSGESAETVSQEVTSTYDSLREILEALCLREENGTVKPEAAVSNISVSHTHLALASKDRNENETGDVSDNPRIHYATIAFYAIFCDFDEMYEFVQKLDGYHNARLNDVSWRLTDSTNYGVGAQLRKGAFRDAVRKAKAYSAVIGLDKVKAVNLKEIEPQPLNPSASPQGPTYRHSSGVDLMPRDVVFNCAVEVYFEKLCGFGLSMPPAHNSLIGSYY